MVGARTNWSASSCFGWVKLLDIQPGIYQDMEENDFNKEGLSGVSMTDFIATMKYNATQKEKRRTKQETAAITQKTRCIVVSFEFVPFSHQDRGLVNQF